MGKVTISSSVEHSPTIFIISPISGDQKIAGGKILSAIVNTQVSTAITDDCESESPEVGADCMIYGESTSGKCILVSKTITKEGGGTASPYIVENLSFIGTKE